MNNVLPFPESSFYSLQYSFMQLKCLFAYITSITVGVCCLSGAICKLLVYICVYPCIKIFICVC